MTLTLNFRRELFSVHERLLQANSFKRKVLGRLQWVSLCCVPREILLALALILLQYEKMIVHKNILKSRMK